MPQGPTNSTAPIEAEISIQHTSAGSLATGGAGGTGTRENWSVIAPGFYLVRTQAGFRQAAKHFADDRWDELKGYGVPGFPTAYPAVCTFWIGYGGNWALCARSVPLNKMRSALDGQ